MLFDKKIHYILLLYRLLVCLTKFMAENFGYEPTEEQRALFAEVLEWSAEEGDLG